MTEQTERSPAGRSLDEPARPEPRAGADDRHGDDGHGGARGTGGTGHGGVAVDAAGHTATVALPATAPPPLAEPRPLGEPRTWPRDFTDRLTAPLPGVRALARIAREGKLRPSPEMLRQIQQLPFEPGPMPRVGPSTLALTWAGHASWVIRIGGLTVLTDPVWSRKILGTPARVTPVGVRWEDLPPVDAVVISHNHYDHLDARR